MFTCFMVLFGLLLNNKGLKMILAFKSWRCRTRPADSASLWNLLEMQIISDFPGGPVVKDPSASTGDTGLIPDLGRFHLPWSNSAHSY